MTEDPQQEPNKNAINLEPDKPKLNPDNIAGGWREAATARLKRQEELRQINEQRNLAFEMSRKARRNTEETTTSATANGVTSIEGQNTMPAGSTPETGPHIPPPVETPPSTLESQPDTTTAEAETDVLAENPLTPDTESDLVPTTNAVDQIDAQSQSSAQVESAGNQDALEEKRRTERARDVVNEKILHFRILLGEMKPHTGVGSILNPGQREAFGKQLDQYEVLANQATNIDDLITTLSHFKVDIDAVARSVSKNQNAAQNYFQRRLPIWSVDQFSSFNIKRNELPVAISNLAIMNNSKG